MPVNIPTLEKHLMIMLRQYARACGIHIVMTNGELLERTRRILQGAPHESETRTENETETQGLKCTCPMSVLAGLTVEQAKRPNSSHSIACPLYVAWAMERQ